MLAALIAALLVTVTTYASPAWARFVRMQTVVTLTDHSDPGVKQALMDAFDTSMRGAVAMGFSHIRVDGIQVLTNVVVLATIASDEDDEDVAPDNTRDQ